MQAARGLDVPHVEHVINFSLPKNFTTYVHRIGRTGRAGATGIATSFYTPGFAPHTGNGKMAPMILQSFRDAKQKVPEWFEQLREVSHGEEDELEGDRHQGADSGEDDTHDVRDAEWQRKRRERNEARDAAALSELASAGKTDVAPDTWMGRKHVSMTKLIDNIVRGKADPSTAADAEDTADIDQTRSSAPTKRKSEDAVVDSAVPVNVDGDNSNSQLPAAKKKKKRSKKKRRDETTSNDYSAADVARLQNVMKQLNVPIEDIEAMEEESEQNAPSHAQRTEDDTAVRGRQHRKPSHKERQSEGSASAPSTKNDLQRRFEALKRKFENIDRKNVA